MMRKAYRWMRFEYGRDADGENGVAVCDDDGLWTMEGLKKWLKVVWWSKGGRKDERTDLMGISIVGLLCESMLYLASSDSMQASRFYTNSHKIDFTYPLLQEPTHSTRILQVKHASINTKVLSLKLLVNSATEHKLCWTLCPRYKNRPSNNYAFRTSS